VTYANSYSRYPATASNESPDHQHGHIHGAHKHTTGQLDGAPSAAVEAVDTTMEVKSIDQLSDRWESHSQKCRICSQADVIAAKFYRSLLDIDALSSLMLVWAVLINAGLNASLFSKVANWLIYGIMNGLLISNLVIKLLIIPLLKWDLNDFRRKLKTTLSPDHFRSIAVGYEDRKYATFI
jgi:hypothetical protein